MPAAAPAADATSDALPAKFGAMLRLVFALALAAFAAAFVLVSAAVVSVSGICTGLRARSSALKTSLMVGSFEPLCRSIPHLRKN